MSTHQALGPFKPRIYRPQVDSVTAFLAACMTIVFALGAWFLHPIITTDQFSIPAFATAGDTITGGDGIMLLAIIIVETVVVLGVITSWRRLPETIREAVGRLLKWTVIVGPVPLAVIAGRVDIAIGYVALQAMIKGAERLDISWTLWNATGLGLAAAGAAILGAQLSIEGVVAILVLAALYDHVAVNLSSLMDRVIGTATSVPLPVYVVIPAALRFDFDDVEEWVDSGDPEDRPAGVAGLIGLGDFVFPMLLPMALLAQTYTTGQPTTLQLAGALSGTFVGLAVLRAAQDAESRARPALPYVNTGALCGWGVGIAVTALVGVF